jgi:AcrR family transcriptional regulator
MAYPPDMSHGPVWARDTKERRPRLTRDDVVAAAIELADQEGIAAVSIRRVAAKLGTRPMGLYSHFERKDDLLDLMFDEIVGDAVAGDELPDDWREALRTIARQTRATMLRHPWILGALAMRPQVGPNRVRHVEESARAVASLDIEPARKRAILVAVDTFVIGAVTFEVAIREAERSEGAEPGSWRRTSGEYLRRVLRSGEFPELADPDLRADEILLGAEDVFETGLNWLLAGFEASLTPQG